MSAPRSLRMGGASVNNNTILLFHGILDYSRLSLYFRSAEQFHKLIDMSLKDLTHPRENATRK
jgi:hypothetical protein